MTNRLLLALACVLLAVRLPSLVQPMGADQGLYAYVGEGVRSGELPYRDAWDQKPPAIHVAYGADARNPAARRGSACRRPADRGGRRCPPLATGGHARRRDGWGVGGDRCFWPCRILPSRGSAV